jgi:cholesterol transport system auxiliary component
MRILALGKKIGMVGLCLLLGACAPMHSSNQNRYQLTESGKVKEQKSAQRVSLLVMQPSAVDGYDTNQMLYVNKPFELSAFADNSWMSPPVTMLLPLMIRSIESSHYFYAVTSDLNASKTDYRLESQLIRLQQNFLVKPSQIQLIMRVMLIHSADSHVLATTTLYESIACPSDTPLGGVIAANQAARRLTAQITHFVVAHVKRAQK